MTVSPPFTAQIASGIDYQLHQFEPKKKFASLDSARLQVSNDVFKLVVDETITTDAFSNEYAIPTSIERGPSQVYLECGSSPVASWNFIPDPEMTTAMPLWSSNDATASVYSSSENDLYIPKYGTSCVKVVVASGQTGGLTLTEANLANNVTPATAAGRLMTFAAWVYCKSASNIQLEIHDDSGVPTASAKHQGLGWELIYAEGTIKQDNTTLLRVEISETLSTGVTFYINSMWFYYGAFTQLNNQYYYSIPLSIQRDDTRKRFKITEPVAPHLQLRLVGKAAITALGSVLSTQVTNTMEVSDGTAEILYAKAAEILFEQERISTQNMAQVAQRIGYVKDRTPELRMNWDQEMPSQRIVGPYRR